MECEKYCAVGNEKGEREREKSSDIAFDQLNDDNLERAIDPIVLHCGNPSVENLRFDSDDIFLPSSSREIL